MASEVFVSIGLSIHSFVVFEPGVSGWLRVSLRWWNVFGLVCARLGFRSRCQYDRN